MTQTQLGRSDNSTSEGEENPGEENPSSSQVHAPEAGSGWEGGRGTGRTWKRRKGRRSEKRRKGEKKPAYMHSQELSVIT